LRRTSSIARLRVSLYSHGRSSSVGGVAGAQRVVHADQHVLHDVFGVVLAAAQQRVRVADQRAAMTRVEHRERRAVARADATGELVVIVARAVKDGGHGF